MDPRGNLMNPRGIHMKFNNLLLLLWLFEVGASKKKARGWPG